MTKTLGLIGTGMIGGTLARLAVAAGLNVVLSNSRGHAGRGRRGR
ncbi:NAD(P)-binding domain-containing protein [Nonomuraea aurantiaca]|nr:NAD(P)-binding domain-containing protein [Nonomuraea aurantiaca]